MLGGIERRDNPSEIFFAESVTRAAGLLFAEVSGPSYAAFSSTEQ